MRPPLFPGTDTKQGQDHDAGGPSVPASPLCQWRPTTVSWSVPSAHRPLSQLLPCLCDEVSKPGVALTSSHHGLTPAPAIPCHRQPPPAITELQALLQPQPRGRAHQCHLSLQRAQSRILLPPAGPPAARGPARAVLLCTCRAWSGGSQTHGHPIPAERAVFLLGWLLRKVWE